MPAAIEGDRQEVLQEEIRIHTDTAVLRFMLTVEATQAGTMEEAYTGDLKTTCRTVL